MLFDNRIQFLWKDLLCCFTQTQVLQREDIGFRLAVSRSAGNTIQLSPITQATFQIKKVLAHSHYHPLLEEAEDSKNEKQV